MFSKIAILFLCISSCSATIVSNLSSCETLDGQCDVSKESEHNRLTPNQFTGSAINVAVNETKNGYWTSPYVVYYRYLSTGRDFLSFNYSGTTARVTIFYSNFFSSDSYLTKIDNFGSAIDCYYFDKNVEYIIKMEMTSANGIFSYSFCLEQLDYSMINSERYALHLHYRDSYGEMPYYNVEYINSNSNYTNTNSTIIPQTTATSYYDLIDDYHGFGVNNDNRRLVANTGYFEYNGIGYAGVSYQMNTYNSVSHVNDLDLTVRSARLSGSFIKENIVLSCAHSFYRNPDDCSSTTIANSFCIYPGINSYPSGGFSTLDYGSYRATEAFVSVSYVLYYNKQSFSYKAECAANDWAVILVDTPEYPSTYSHSCFGLSAFSDLTNAAVCVGYPSLQICPNSDEGVFCYSMWATYPLEGQASVVVLSANLSYVYSSYHKISKGNSGGPLYIRSTYILNGQLHRDAWIIGVSSGAPSNGSYGWFFRITAFYIGLFLEIIDSYET